MAAKRSVRDRLKDKYKSTKNKVTARLKAEVSKIIPKKQREANPFNARAGRSTIREHNKEIDIRKYMK